MTVSDLSVEGLTGLLDGDGTSPRLRRAAQHELDRRNSKPTKADRAPGLRLIGYLRVSTQGQAVDGFGLPAQKHAVGKWAKEHGHEVVAWCQDAGVSGTVDGLERPGFSCVVESLRAERADGVVTFDLSRLARLLHVQEAALNVLWRLNARVFTVTAGELEPDKEDDPTRTLIRQVLGAVAQFERANIMHKMNMGRARKVANGGRGAGRPPYGWDAKGGELVANVAEQKVLERMRQWSADGVQWWKIAEWLNADGVRGKGGAAWCKQSAHLALQRADARIAAVQS